MRTTVTLDDDAAAAANELRRQEGIGISEALNRLARAGLAKPTKRKVYKHWGTDIGVKVDLTCIGSSGMA
ncbi:MAG: ribbon-helix-helix protein, CopG family [Chloroflexi bacterium]|nr:ribbon-helix-helix protein, CopG family [Chloroflexota bacterium]